jgi:hypothetical protein
VNASISLVNKIRGEAMTDEEQLERIEEKVEKIPLEFEFDKQVCVLCGDGTCRVRHALERREDGNRVCGCYYYYKGG